MDEETQKNPNRHDVLGRRRHAMYSAYIDDITTNIDFLYEDDNKWMDCVGSVNKDNYLIVDNNINNPNCSVPKWAGRPMQIISCMEKYILSGDDSYFEQIYANLDNISDEDIDNIQNIIEDCKDFVYDKDKFQAQFRQHETEMLEEYKDSTLHPISDKKLDAITPTLTQCPYVMNEVLKLVYPNSDYLAVPLGDRYNDVFEQNENFYNCCFVDRNNYSSFEMEQLQNYYEGEISSILVVDNKENTNLKQIGYTNSLINTLINTNHLKTALCMEIGEPSNNCNINYLALQESDPVNWTELDIAEIQEDIVTPIQLEFNKSKLKGVLDGWNTSQNRRTIPQTLSSVSYTIAPELKSRTSINDEAEKQKINKKVQNRIDKVHSEER